MCICIHLYIHVRIRIYVYIYICMYTHIHTYLYTRRALHASSGLQLMEQTVGLALDLPLRALRPT